MDIKTKSYTIGQNIVDLILENKHPLQRKDILFLYTTHIDNISPDLLSVSLHKLCKIGRIKMVKYPGMPSFYSHPDKDFNNFDPTTKKFKDELNTQD